MTVLSAMRRLFAGATTSLNGSAYPYDQHVKSRIEPIELPPAALYAVLRLFDLSNGLYDDLSRANVAIGRATAQVRAIRNPVPAVCDAWAAKLWPEPLTLVTENAAIVAPIEQIYRWSNWRASRPKVARWTALYGESWIHVQADPLLGRVWYEYLEPAYVTSFEEDARGYVQEVRVDIPKTVDADDAEYATTSTTRTHTEVWSAADQLYRRWETDGDACGRKLSDLGTPAETESLSAFGIDFVPFVRIPFSDSGEARGIGAVQRALEAVSEADLSATNLHAMVYQDAEGAWVVTANGTDAAGRPIPPMQVAAAQPTYDALGRQTGNGTGVQSDGSITVGKRSFWRLPGGYALQSVVPNIDFAGALAILQDHDTVLERLMPALAYARISEMSGGDLSGRAIRFKLTPFIDQVTGVRATALEKLEQADMMALTLGRVNGLPGFDGLGSFDDGSFAHDFEPVDIIPLSDLEEAQAEAQRAQAYATWETAGLPMVENLIRAGYTKQEATRLVRLATQQADEAVQRQQELFSQQGGPQDQQQGQGGQQGA
jgi:hypothetical protein